jgi:hypothetical protein
MSLTFKVPVTQTELEIEKRDQVVAPLKGGSLGAFLGWAAGMVWHYFRMAKYETFSLLTATPGVVILTAIGVVGGAVIASGILNKDNAKKITKDGVKLCKDKTCELGDRAVSVLDRYLPAPSEKAKAKAAEQNKPQEEAPKAVTPALDAARSANDEGRAARDVYNNCTFYGPREDEPRGREQAQSISASRSKTPTRKSTRSPVRKK